MTMFVYTSYIISAWATQMNIRAHTFLWTCHRSHERAELVYPCFYELSRRELFPMQCWIAFSLAVCCQQINVSYANDRMCSTSEILDFCSLLAGLFVSLSANHIWLQSLLNFRWQWHIFMGFVDARMWENELVVEQQDQLLPHLDSMYISSLIRCFSCYSIVSIDKVNFTMLIVVNNREKTVRVIGAFVSANFIFFRDNERYWHRQDSTRTSRFCFVRIFVLMTRTDQWMNGS
jgi:hypothetical protein